MQICPLCTCFGLATDDSCGRVTTAWATSSTSEMPVPSGAGPVAGSRDCYLLPKCAGAQLAEPDEAERLVAADGFDGFWLITHRDQYLVTAQRYAAGKAHRPGARRMTARGTRRGITERSAREMDDERFLNSYHNASTPPGPDVPADLAGFMLAADPVLSEAAELSRVLAHAHQGAATQLIGEDWAHARKYFSLSEKYAAWADYC